MPAAPESGIAEPSLPSPRLSRLALILLLALPVLALNPWVKEPFMAPKDVTVQLLIVCLLMGMVLSRASSRLRIPVSPLSIPLAGLIVLSGVSALLSLDPLWSLLEVVHLALLVILFHLLLGRDEVGERVTLVFRTMAIVGGVASLYGLLQVAGVELVQTDTRFVPLTFFGHRNYAAEYIVLVLPPALALTLLAQTRRALTFWSAISVLLVLHLAATQTRAALLGLTLGLFGAGAFWWRSAPVSGARSPSRRRWLLVGSILALGYVLFLFPRPFQVVQPVATRVLESEGWSVERAQALATRNYPEKTLLDPANLRSRLSVWRAGLQLIRDHPWTGVGLGNFVLVFPPKYQPFDRWWPQGLATVYLHNDLLQVAAELGLPAMVLALWALIVLAGILCRSLRQGRIWPEPLWIAASLCALIAIGVDSLFSFPWHLPVQRLYAVVHGAGLVALAWDQRPKEIRIARPFGLAVAGALALIVVLGAVRLHVAEVYASSGWNALLRGDQAGATAAYHAANAWFPQMFPRSQRVMQAQDPRPHYAQAVSQFREAVRLDPQDQVALTNLGRALQGAGRLDEAHKVFHRLLEMRPADPQVLRRLIDLALAGGRPGEAYRYYETLTAVAPCDGPLLFTIAVWYRYAGQWEAARIVQEQAVACNPRLKRFTQ